MSLKKEEGVGPGSSPVVTTGGQGGRSYPYSMPQQVPEQTLAGMVQELTLHWLICKLDTQ